MSEQRDSRRVPTACRRLPMLGRTATRLRRPPGALPAPNPPGAVWQVRRVPASVPAGCSSAPPTRTVGSGSRSPSPYCPPPRSGLGSFPQERQRRRPGDSRRLRVLPATRTGPRDSKGSPLAGGTRSPPRGVSVRRMGRPSARRAISAAASAPVIPVWHVAQGSGAPTASATSGSGTRKEWSPPRVHPPCRCVPACGRRRTVLPQSPTSWKWCPAPSNREAAWQTVQTALPSPRTRRECALWQSLQVTPARNIALCANEPQT